METALEKFLSHCRKEALDDYAETHQGCFEEAMKMIKADKRPYAWRAAWLLAHCMKKNDAALQKHVNTLIEMLPYREESAQREILKILHEMKVETDIEGLLFEHCVNIWQQTNKQTSVRFNALKLICRICDRQPDLKAELLVLTQTKYLNKISVPVKNSIAKMLRKTLKNS